MDFSRQRVSRVVCRKSEIDLCPLEIRVKVQESVNTEFGSPLMHSQAAPTARARVNSTTSSRCQQHVGHIIEPASIAMECCDAAFHDSLDSVMYSESCASHLAYCSLCDIEQCHSIHTTTPVDVLVAPSAPIGAIVRSENPTPPTVPRCDSLPQVWGTQPPMTPGTVPAIQVLRRVFSTSNLTRHAPEMYSIRALRKLYLCAHARGTLSDLSDTQFSAIIALFGTLSVPNPPNEFKSPLAQHTEKRQSRAWWGFILQMVQDKKRVTGILKGCDLYWLMRARASGTSLNDLNMYVGNGGEFFIIMQ
jgi:hypothetical protein